MSIAEEPTVFLSVPQGVAAANMLRSGLIGRLLSAHPDARVVVLSPLVQDPAFVREFAHPRVVFEPLPPHRPAGIEARLVSLIQAGYLTSGITESVRVRRAEAIARRSIRWLRAKRVLARLLAPSILRKETRYELVDRLVKHPWAEALFDRYRPSLLVTAGPGLIFAEIPLLRTAAQRGVRSMVVDASWDNFTNKLLPARRVDRLLVWNDVMKQQAVDLHGYRPDAIRVTGVPQFDRYFRAATLSSREAFFQRIGADPARKLVTLTTTARALYPHYERLIQLLIDAMNSGAWPHPVQLLVRVHPRDELERYAQFLHVPNVIVEKPFRATVSAGDGLTVDIMPADTQHLADTMRHSDVVISVVSTISIEAAIFDTPIINVSFDGEQPEPFARSARRYFCFTHFANLLRHNPGSVAESPEQLVAQVGRYLTDPTLEAEGRRRVVLEQCQFLDGLAAERVAAFVVEELSAVRGPVSSQLTAAAR